MEADIKLRVVTPEGGVVDEKVSSVSAFSEVGEFCILPMHRPMLAALRPGRLMFETESDDLKTFAMDKGFFECGPGHVNIITAHCESTESIDVESARAKLLECEKSLESLEAGSPEYESCLAEVSWHSTRVDLCEDK